jgi:DNA-binding transcriptional ArsR family regulator
MKKIHQQNADILKALGHPVRFCIVEGLCAGEHPVGDMVQCTRIPQPTVSQHLNILKAACILRGRREGKRIVYSVCSPVAKKVIQSMK